MNNPGGKSSASAASGPGRIGSASGMIGRFLIRVIIVYVLLTLPWPGWDRLYREYFSALGGLFFHDNDERELAFQVPGPGSPRPLDTRIEIANRALLHPDGSGPVRDLDLDAREFAWQATALLLALVVATPISWRRRGWALLWGQFILHVCILLLLGFCIWDESAQIGLVILTPFWQHIADVLRGMVAQQSTLVLPPIIWLLITFRREDRAMLPFVPAPGAVISRSPI